MCSNGCDINIMYLNAKQNLAAALKTVKMSKQQLCLIKKYIDKSIEKIRELNDISNDTKLNEVKCIESFLNEINQISASSHVNNNALFAPNPNNDKKYVINFSLMYEYVDEPGFGELCGANTPRFEFQYVAPYVNTTALGLVKYQTNYNPWSVMFVKGDCIQVTGGASIQIMKYDSTASPPAIVVDAGASLDPNATYVPVLGSETQWLPSSALDATTYPLVVNALMESQYNVNSAYEFGSGFLAKDSEIVIWLRDFSKACKLVLLEQQKMECYLLVLGVRRDFLKCYDNKPICPVNFRQCLPCFKDDQDSDDDCECQRNRKNKKCGC